jgi:hypothetical protein
VAKLVGPGLFVIGQEPDSYGGGYDKDQSFSGLWYTFFSTNMNIFLATLWSFDLTVSLSINFDKSIKQKFIEFIDKLVVDKSINFDKS